MRRSDSIVLYSDTPTAPVKHPHARDAIVSHTEATGRFPDRHLWHDKRSNA
ncbi:hypothetical protein ACYOEI_27675 [Singulisphaera rosea]